ncbi:hypothetical protein [Streptomyces fuscigenes]|uniref:hypothetical protein n=1 Tax=Streptomyces fuscigenes TaxID=1528880 RepID=UPI001F3260FC|nr:hypothetical protein [Streptomyces fuscigenes]MCF3964130.1 hypothetical protein [Streptomyces fuscigenes]
MSFGDEHDYSGDPGHTRTRLPGSEGDGYGGGRRPARTSRSLVTVVGVVVLLIAAIAFANRGGGSHGTASDGNDRSPGKGAAADPTAPSNVKPVKGRAAGPDTSIPGGYAEDQQGAASAAANYAVALGSEGMFHMDRRHAILDTIYTPAAAAKLTTSLDAAYSADFLSKLGLDASGDAPQGSTFVSRTIPVGTKVLGYSQGAAKISVWYTGLIGMAGSDSTNPVTTTWKTSTFQLQWTNNDWKIVSDTEKDGPAPVPGDDAASTADQITQAVEQFGGFTYAR